jgi:hypothetical protein
MRLLRILFPAWMVCATALGALGQDREATPAGAGMYAERDGAAMAGAPIAGQEWVPEGIVTLRKSAYSKTEFTLNHTILKFAAMLDRNNPDLRRVVAGLNGVSVHSFRYPMGVPLDAARMASISQEYQSAGWMHLVKKRKNNGGETTDLWIHMEQESVRDVAVLMVRAKQVDFISASGAVSPLDLLHLSGHFGIPKMDPGAAVPVPGQKP